MTVQPVIGIFNMPVKDDAFTQHLLETYEKQVEAFKQFCLQLDDTCGNDSLDEVDMYDLSVGFFIALGVIGDSGMGEPFYDAFCLATVCRYDFEYWA